MSELNELLGKKKDLSNKIRIEKAKQHNEFVICYKKWLGLLDILFIISMAFNYGALAITEITVEKQHYAIAKENNITITYQEVMPVAAKIHGYQETEKERFEIIRILFVILNQTLLWCLIGFIYIILRYTMRDNYSLYLLTFLVCFYFSLLGFDFLHDLNLFISKIVYGG